MTHCGSHIRWPEVGPEQAQTTAPGHMRNLPTPAGEAPVLTVEMKRGDMLVFDQSIWHASGVNQTQETRTGLFQSYVAGWVRPDEQWLLQFSREEIRGLPRRLQELIGLSQYACYTGWVNGRHPLTWVDPNGDYSAYYQDAPPFERTEPIS